VQYLRSEQFITKSRLLWKSGLSFTEIAKKLDVSKGVISGIAYRNGFPQRRLPYFDTANRNALIVKEWKINRTSQKEIARKFSVGVSTVEMAIYRDKHAQSHITSSQPGAQNRGNNA
jgi:transposase